MTDFTINKKKHIQEIIENFNFTKVHKVMTLLSCEWFGHDGVPTIEDLKNSATKMLYDLCESNFDTSSTGGFKVTKHDDYLELEFIIDGYESSILNYGPEYERRKKLKTRKKKINKINE